MHPPGHWGCGVEAVLTAYNLDGISLVVLGVVVVVVMLIVVLYHVRLGDLRSILLYF